MRNPGGLKQYDWYQLRNTAIRCMAQEQIKQPLHEIMQPYYVELMETRLRIFDNASKGIRAKAFFVVQVFEADESAVEWVSERYDIFDLTEKWIAGASAGEYRKLLHHLGKSGFNADLSVTKAQVNERLQRLEVEGSRRADKDVGEYYCCLHAFCMIRDSEFDASKRDELFDAFFDNWDFIRYVYSVMLRCVVGSKLANIVAVANVVENNASYAPYLRLFYAPLKERRDDFCQKDCKAERLDASILKIEKKMQQTEPSHELDELFEVLFPEEFRDMLNHHRMKSYRELESEIGQVKNKLEATAAELDNQAKEMAKRLSAALEASVPIQEIEDELMKFQSREALAIFMQLNILLVGNKAWNTRSLAIRDKILNKQQQEMTYSMTITAQPGSNVNGFVQQQTNHALGYNPLTPLA